MVPPYPVEQKVKLNNWLLFLQQASASVYYWITDINDHYPHFSSQHYNATVGEVSDNNCSHTLILFLDFLWIKFTSSTQIPYPSLHPKLAFPPLEEGANGGTQFSVNYYFSAKYQLTTIFLANSQLTTNFGQLLTFTLLQRILFRHNENFPSFSKSITFGGRS